MNTSATSCAPTRRRSPGHDEAGAAGTVWAVLIVAGAFMALLGLVVDGGQVLGDRSDASRIAAQAARRGADELSSAALRNGADVVAGDKARASAREFLTSAGMNGAITVDGDQVTVTVRGRTQTTFLKSIGISSFGITETRTAEGIEEGEDQ